LCFLENFGKAKDTKQAKNQGGINWKFLYLICAFALIKDAARKFLDALF